MSFYLAPRLALIWAAIKSASIVLNTREVERENTFALSICPQVEVTRRMIIFWWSWVINYVEVDRRRRGVIRKAAVHIGLTWGRCFHFDSIGSWALFTDDAPTSRGGSMIRRQHAYLLVNTTGLMALIGTYIWNFIIDLAANK